MRKLVTVEEVKEITPIGGADRIEHVRVRDWWVVCPKNQFKVQDRCLYYEIDSFLPIKPEYDFLLKGGHPKKMLADGVEKEGIRLKTIRLKGALSQGLILPVPEDITDEIGTDVSEKLGVIKYEAPIPPQLSGVMKGSFPSYIPKSDEPRIQNFSEVLTQYYISEKLDGSSTTFFKKDGVFGVCSRNLELEEGNTTQWRVARRYDLANKLPDNMAIQCELVGEGIQGNPLKLNGQDIFCFNVYNINAGIYLNYADFVGFCNSIGVKTVPIIDDNFSLLNSVDEFLNFAEGKSLLNPLVEREGIVVRPKIEMKYKGQRLSFKVISNKYLLNNEQ